ncbi:phosphoenolpyruvate carboxykinase, partial [Striga asiatica]
MRGCRRGRFTGEDGIAGEELRSGRFFAREELRSGRIQIRTALPGGMRVIGIADEREWTESGEGRSGEAVENAADREPEPRSPTIGVSDSSLKFTHVLYNLSPAELYEQAIKYEKGSFITSSGAIATLSGAKTDRSPKNKRVVRDETTEDELWWG